MRKKVITIFLIGLFLFTLSQIVFSNRVEEGFLMKQSAYDIEKVCTLFSLSPNVIEKKVNDWIKSATKNLNLLLSLPENERTYDNTMAVLDQLCTLSDVSIGNHILDALELLHPDKSIRDAAHEGTLKIQAFYINSVVNNKKLYHAIQSYTQKAFLVEKLREDQRYFVTETMKDFERSGLALSDEKLEKIKAINMQMSELSSDFERNIAQDNRSIIVSKNDLTGMSDSFIAALEQTADGQYKLGVDYPTYIPIMENCTVANTRKNLWKEFANRGYPKNDLVLKQLISLRDQKAKLLGFTSYAALELDSQMVQTEDRARKFISDLYAQTQSKVSQEYGLLLKNVPASVTLSDEGKIYPWDIKFLENQYKKNYCALDEEKIKEYFPLEHTIEQLLSIYEQFLSVHFERVQVKDLWHEDIEAIQVYDKNKEELLGTLFLDLHPRDNKYSHAAHATVISGVKNEQEVIPDVSIVIANFPKSTKERPSLLSQNDVSTFFHEFGHAMHAILGQTAVASFAGTNTKRDFVELPSQMLEEWLFDKDILKMVSSHYQTGESLPDVLIDSIVKNKNVFSGTFVARQAYFSQLAIDYFASGADKDVFTIMKDLHLTLRPHIQFDDNDHFYASFGHLTGYGSKYYGYMWSKVFALDMFAQIKKHGLLDPVIGQKYVQTVLAQGGSKDPNELLKDFLGREPNNKAFLQDLGLAG